MVVQSVLEISSEHYYSCELTQRIPVRVSIVAINGDTGLGILEPLEGGEDSLQQYVNELLKSPSIRSVEVTHSAPDAYWTHVIHHVEEPSIYETVLQSGCMTFLPIVVERGVQKHTILAPTRNVLSELLHLLRDRFTYVRVLRVRASPIGLSREILTSKQKEAFILAFESGYYAIPRSVTLEKLAKKIGIKRVAMQERLRRAEYRILSHYIKG